MSGKQDKILRKENQIQQKDLKHLVDKVIQRQMQMPFKKRMRLALKIMFSSDIFLLILFFIISQALSLGILLLFISLYQVWGGA